MQPEFWHKRWASNQIGFHLPEVNPHLQRFWPALGLEEGARVLVPLCGKSLDLLWLAHKGHEVLGIELSEKAVEDFFAEHQFDPDISEQGPFKVYRAGSIELWCGDFFELTAGDVAARDACAIRGSFDSHSAEGFSGAVDYPGLRSGADGRAAVCGAG
jgi:thiopurine S-methyltransferase